MTLTHALCMHAKTKNLRAPWWAQSRSLVARTPTPRNQHAAPRSNADACRRVTSAYNQITKACGLSQAVAEEEVVSEAKDDANY